MAKFMQEKNQILNKPRPPEKTKWADLNSALHAASDYTADMPPGDDIMNQDHVEEFTPISLGGEHSVTDHVSSGLKKGYTRGKMNPSDDQYPGEGIDLWYGEAVDDQGNVGFLERNNYLDRI